MHAVKPSRFGANMNSRLAMTKHCATNLPERPWQLVCLMLLLASASGCAMNQSASILQKSDSVQPRQGEQIEHQKLNRVTPRVRPASCSRPPIVSRQTSSESPPVATNSLPPAIEMPPSSPAAPAATTRTPIQPYDAVQATYQQPLGRTYATPTSLQHHGHPGFGVPPGSAPQYDPYQQRTYEELPAPLPDAFSVMQRPPIDPQMHGIAPAPQLEAPPDHQAIPHSAPVAQATILPDSLNAIPMADPAYQPTEFVQPIDQYTSEHAGGTLTHLADGINVGGSELRRRSATATERALQLKNENEALRQKLEALGVRVSTLQKDIESRDEQLRVARRQTDETNRTNASLRDSIATFKVKLRESENEKIAIQRHADSALKEIESTLDAVLLNTLSDARKP